MPSNSRMHKFRLTFHWAGGKTPDFTRIVRFSRKPPHLFSFTLQSCKNTNGYSYTGRSLTEVSRVLLAVSTPRIFSSLVIWTVSMCACVCVCTKVAQRGFLLARAGLIPASYNPLFMILTLPVLCSFTNCFLHCSTQSVSLKIQN